MITGDYCSHFIARGMSASSFFRATTRRDDKLVAVKNEPRRKFTARFRQRIIQHFRAPYFFRLRHHFGRENISDVPFFGRTDELGHVALVHIDIKQSWAPEIAFVSVTPTLLDTVNDLVNDLG